MMRLMDGLNLLSSNDQRRENRTRDKEVGRRSNWCFRVLRPPRQQSASTCWEVFNLIQSDLTLAAEVSDVNVAAEQQRVYEVC